MAKQIIILDRVAPGRFRYALWAAVPAARQSFYAQVGRVSAWSAASLLENQALESGAVTEFVDTTAFLPGATLAEIQAGLQARWQQFQNEITARNPWVRQGTFFDGTIWTPGGVM